MAYYARRKASGKTNREPALKRYIARNVYNTLQIGAHLTT